MMSNQPQQPSINPDRVLGTFGRIIAADTEDDNTNKMASYAGLPFVSLQIPVAGYNINAQAAANLAEIGGGPAAGQAATRIDFYTSAAVNTASGTRRWQLDSVGDLAPVSPNTNDLGISGQAVRNGFINRIVAEGTAHVVGDYTLSVGWGATASLALVGSPNDARGIVDITANGAGIAANPTVTLVFTDGVFPATVTCSATRGDLNAPNAYWAVNNQATIFAVYAFVGLPVAGTTYRLLFHNSA